MTLHIDILELRERGIGDHLQGFASRIGKEVEVGARQGSFRAVEKLRDKPLHRCEDKSGTGFMPDRRRICEGSLPTGMAFIDTVLTTGKSFD